MGSAAERRAEGCGGGGDHRQEEEEGLEVARVGDVGDHRDAVKAVLDAKGRWPQEEESIDYLGEGGRGGRRDTTRRSCDLWRDEI